MYYIAAVAQSISKNSSAVSAHLAVEVDVMKNCDVNSPFPVIKLICLAFTLYPLFRVVAFKVYDMDRDGYISNGELFLVLKMMVGSNLQDNQLQQIVVKTIMEADKDMDGKISFEEFCGAVENTDIARQMTLETF